MLRYRQLQMLHTETDLLTEFMSVAWFLRVVLQLHIVEIQMCLCRSLTFLSAHSCDRLATASRKICDGAVSVAARHAWNRLSTDLKLTCSTRHLKTFLFRVACNYTRLICDCEMLPGNYYYCMERTTRTRVPVLLLLLSSERRVVILCNRTYFGCD